MNKETVERVRISVKLLGLVVFTVGVIVDLEGYGRVAAGIVLIGIIIVAFETMSEIILLEQGK